MALFTTFLSSWQLQSKEWLLRFAITLALAVAWHVLSSWFGLTKKAREAVPAANPTTTSEQSDSPESNPNAAVLSRQAFLDQLEKSKTLAASCTYENGNGVHDGVVSKSISLVDQSHSDDKSSQNATPESKTITEDIESPTTATLDTQADHESKLASKSTSAKLKIKRANRCGRPPSSQRHPSSSTNADEDTIVFHNDSPFHPGLAASGFHNWYDVETSLYRIYRLGRMDGVDVIPPYLPQSRRGNVKIYLQVTNAVYCTIEAFWVDFQGREISKGKFQHGTVWTQTTWMEHPWVFRKCDVSTSSQLQGNSQDLLLHHIPYRVIPTTSGVPTASPDDPNVGMHQFTITTNRRHDESFWACQVEDPVLPHPASRHFENNTDTAIAWVLQHMLRTNYPDLSLVVLEKYLKNITLRPEEGKYRHWRTASSTKFHQHVWSRAARGLLLCLGAVEHGAYCELGNADALRHERVQDISQLLLTLQRWKENRDRDEGFLSQQPEGAEDGYGRAGFERAGQIN